MNYINNVGTQMLHTNNLVNETVPPPNGYGFEQYGDGNAADPYLRGQQPHPQNQTVQSFNQTNSEFPDNHSMDARVVAIPRRRNIPFLN